MTSPELRLRTRGRGRDPRREHRTTRFLAINAAFLLALYAVGAVSIWPIYQSTAFIVVAVFAASLATVIAVTAMRRRWKVYGVVLATIGVYFVGGVPLAVPSAFANPTEIWPGLQAVIAAPVTGWKDILTLELPLGSYQATLAPAYLLLLAVPVLALSLAWRARRLWVLAAPIMLVLPIFGLLCGSSVLNQSFQTYSQTPFMSTEFFIGVFALLLSLGWYIWRALHDRSLVLGIAGRVSGVRITARPGKAVAGRIAIAVSMVVVAVGFGTAATPLVVAGQPRHVLRTDVNPELVIRSKLSPLTAYRSFFNEDTYNEVLFTVSAPASVDRVRLATLRYFDGQVARVVDPSRGDSDHATAFVRVPSTLPVNSASTFTGEVVIGTYNQAWVPLVGDLSAIQFTGDNRAALTDNFYYNSTASMGVELANPGLAPGLTYSFTASSDSENEPSQRTAVASITPSLNASALAESVVPASVRDWIKRQDVAPDGAGLAELVDRLRARGILSHALEIDQSEIPQWVSDLDQYAFEPSRAGHSTDRIDRMFLALLQKENEIGGTVTSSDSDNSALVATPGDDEQFAVGAAMIADQLGFPARIVLGAVLVNTENDAAITACEAGVCRGANMTVWVEVQDIDGSWHPITVTPQHQNSMAPTMEVPRDPQNTTDVAPDRADTMIPPESNPAESGEAADRPLTTTADYSGLWMALRWSGISLLVLLILLGPLLGIVLTKLLRRRGRRKQRDPTHLITGGWDEYVDTAVDFGRPMLRSYTRQELAALYSENDDGAQGTILATWADRSVFDWGGSSPEDGAAFWKIVDAERHRLTTKTSWWAKLRARVSLRSFARQRALRRSPHVGKRAQR